MFEKNFYPTPKELVEKMMEMVDFKNVKNVLEPSAGKGDIIKLVNKKIDDVKNQSLGSYSNKEENYANIDCCEINPSLRTLLKNESCSIVYDDFLKFYTQISYDLIIANPPFDRGCTHLMKMIDMAENAMKSCQIVCLLNADTLHNAFSVERQELLKKLEKHEADVEFIKDAFLVAEKRTKVEVALIYINIKKQSNYNDSLLFNELKQSQNNYDSSNEEKYKNELVSGDMLERLVQQYNFEVKTGLKLINEYNNVSNLFVSSEKYEREPILNLTYSDNPNGYVRKIRSIYWKKLFMNDKFMSLFTNNLRNEYVNKVNELINFEFNLYNIYTIKIELNKKMIAAMEETILKLFDDFTDKWAYREYKDNRYLYNGWKTNQSFKINPKKVIIPHLCAWNYIGESYERFDPTRYEIIDTLRDIEKAFSYLSGEEKTIDIMNALETARQIGRSRKIECEYFYLTFYKKGTAHFEWKDKELIKKLNIYAGKKKGWLNDGFGKKAYSEMNQEEKDVVDSFTDKKDYDNIVKNNLYYLPKFETLKLIS